MIHYTCDRCKRQIDLDQEGRYEVRVEIRVITNAPADLDSDEQAARDLLELEDIINDLDHHTELESPAAHTRTFDLCHECHARFVADPLSNSQAAELGFSEN